MHCAYYKIRGVNIKFYACIVGSIPLTIRITEGNMKAATYLDILQNNVLPSAIRVIGRDFFYLEDNDLKHGGPRGGKIVRNFFHYSKITRLPWPSQSPYLNPMEHV